MTCRVPSLIWKQCRKSFGKDRNFSKLSCKMSCLMSWLQKLKAPCDPTSPPFVSATESHGDGGGRDTPRTSADHVTSILLSCSWSLYHTHQEDLKHMEMSSTISVHTMWHSNLQLPTTVEPPNKGHFGSNIKSTVLSFMERLSSSRRFSMYWNYRGE